MSISLCSPRPSATSRHWVQVRIRVCRRRWPSNQHGAHDPARPRRPRQPCGVGLRVRHPELCSISADASDHLVGGGIGARGGDGGLAQDRGRPPRRCCCSDHRRARVQRRSASSLNRRPRAARPRRPGGRSPPRRSRRSHSLVDARRPLLGRRLRVGGSGLLRRNIDERRRVCRLLPRIGPGCARG